MARNLRIAFIFEFRKPLLDLVVLTFYFHLNFYVCHYKAKLHYLPSLMGSSKCKIHRKNGINLELHATPFVLTGTEIQTTIRKNKSLVDSSISSQRVVPQIGAQLQVKYVLVWLALVWKLTTLG